MKQLFTFMLTLCIIGFANLATAQQIIVTDDASYTTPASGSMLDVKSTSKGFMPPRVALTSLTDVSTIASPATGLMVYNTGAGTLTEKGIFYWNGTSWVKALIGGSGGTNYLSIADDGTVTLHGTATTYDDLRVDGSRVQNSGVTAPNWAVFVGGLYTNFFEDTKTQSVYFNVQMPHAWKQGTDMGAHVHWTTNATAPLATTVRWTIEYQWVNIGSNMNLATNNTTSGYTVLTNANINPDNSLAVGEHAITSMGTISGSGMNLSSVLVCRVYREGAGSNDTYTGNAALLSIDFHYEIDSFGSTTEYAK
jgi:hypothetical protein